MSDGRLEQEIVNNLLKESRRNRRQGYIRMFLTSLFLVYLVVVYAGFHAAFLSEESKEVRQHADQTRNWAQHTSISGKGEGRATIAIIPIRGAISGQPISGGSEGGGLLSSPTQNTVLSIRNTLQRAGELTDLKEVMLFVQSPGGEVTPTDEIYSMIRSWREKHPDIAVSAYVYSMAASGGYWIATAADTISASPTAMVGSIGVIMQTLDISELAEKLGIKTNTITTGEFKDIGNMFREMTDAEKQALRRLAQQSYDRFVDVVDAGRPALDRNQVKALADGRIFSASDAQQNGLIDDIIPTFDAFLEMRAQAVLEKEGAAHVTVMLPAQSRSLFSFALPQLGL